MPARKASPKQIPAINGLPFANVGWCTHNKSASQVSQLATLQRRRNSGTKPNRGDLVEQSNQGIPQTGSSVSKQDEENANNKKHDAK